MRPSFMLSLVTLSLLLSQPALSSANSPGALKTKMKEVVQKCRKMIEEVDRKDDLWKLEFKKGSPLDFKVNKMQEDKKKKYEQLNNYMPFNYYLDTINQLKLKINLEQTAINDLIDTWNDKSEEGLKKLTEKVEEKLVTASQGCNNPIWGLKLHLKEREDLKK